MSWHVLLKLSAVSAMLLNCISLGIVGMHHGAMIQDAAAGAGVLSFCLSASSWWTPCCCQLSCARVSVHARNI